MNPEQPARTSRIASVVALVVLVVPSVASLGCGDHPDAAPRLARDLSRTSVDPRPYDIPLAPRTLAAQADFDALEDAYLASMGRDRMIQVYELLARDANAAVEADAILIQRLAMMHLGASTGTERLQKVFAWADKLRAGAPSSPHTVFLLAHIKRMLLAVGSQGSTTFKLDGRNRDVADKLLADWDQLLALAPNYVGPGGVTGEDLRQDRARLAAVVKAFKPPQAGGVTERKPQRGASDGEIKARTDLWRFEHGSDADRSTLCADRDSAGDSGGRTKLEQWMDLRCAALQGKPDTAEKLFAALGDALTPATRCELLAALQRGADRWGRTIPDGLKTMMAACTQTTSKPTATP